MTEEQRVRFADTKNIYWIYFYLKLRLHFIFFFVPSPAMRLRKQNLYHGRHGDTPLFEEVSHLIDFYFFSPCPTRLVLCMLWENI